MKIIMKRLMPWMIGTATLWAATSLVLAAEEMPGKVDFGAFSPPKGGGQFVQVNVPSSVIALAARFVEKEEPDVAKILSGLKQVTVNVIGLNDENREELQKRAQSIRTDLAGKGWERIVTVQEKDQDVSIYLKMSDSTIQGVTAVVLDGKQDAVFANVVGDIKPEQLAMLGDKFHIDPLKQIGLTAQKTEAKAEEKAK
jgi:hypothetical protein